MIITGIDNHISDIATIAIGVVGFHVVMDASGDVFDIHVDGPISSTATQDREGVFDAFFVSFIIAAI